MPKEATSEQREIKGELWRLTTSDATAKTDAQCENYAIRYSFAPIWTYQVPVGQELVALPAHRIGIYIEDDEGTSAEWGDPQKVRVVAWDAEMKRMQILYEGRYMESKEMQDLDKMATFDIAEPFRLKSGDHIYVEGMCDDGTTALYTIDVSDSYFSIELLRVRAGLFK